MIDYHPSPINSKEEFYESTDEMGFIYSVEIEDMLLLVLAAHKLGLQCLQTLATARIAMDFSDDVTNIKENRLNMQLRNKHVDVCLSYPENTFKTFLWGKSNR